MSQEDGRLAASRYRGPPTTYRRGGGDMQVESWGDLLTNAGPRDHIVQLYQDQGFLNRAVCRFAAAALVNGEGMILVPTQDHWNAFRPRLEAEGIDLDA